VVPLKGISEKRRAPCESGSGDRENAKGINRFSEGEE